MHLISQLSTLRIGCLPANTECKLMKVMIIMQALTLIDVKLVDTTQISLSTKVHALWVCTCSVDICTMHSIAVYL